MNLFEQIQNGNGLFYGTVRFVLIYEGKYAKRQKQINLNSFPLSTNAMSDLLVHTKPLYQQETLFYL